ncbi:Dam family site-specific DNA-(adenine-N6)-methyltransferase [Alicyclobacillus sp.]|uniref:DNA adenine methylase n=1 Tax=Alicyclobacillus sp. TaxID=61169 RepID=UPI0025B9538A|nr:Dam family site-specific DNA-(adenine-N6)-methyltransferase [Alicyclobacillus sp.]MCL6517344.1 Dam family site-specific DNA-(adenine-N6)-methyltransferase [Alicyclobacillus sp.]
MTSITTAQVPDAISLNPAGETSPSPAMEGLKPILKWAGGKRWLVPHLAPLWARWRAQHPDVRLVEPFCGSLAVALGLRAERALLNDLNEHVVHFHDWVRRGLVIEIEMENDAEVYYRQRDRFNTLIAERRQNSAEAASLFYYLNRTGYNGLCRFNRDGLFNVPFGRYKTITYRRTFEEYQAAFRNWTFTTGDFTAIAVTPTDFVYADPPYDVQFRQYAADGFTWADQVRLAEWLASLPGPVVASNQATDRIVELYSSLGFEMVFLDGPRRISCTGDRSPAREMLAFKGV